MKGRRIRGLSGVSPGGTVWSALVIPRATACAPPAEGRRPGSRTVRRHWHNRRMPGRRLALVAFVPARARRSGRCGARGPQRRVDGRDDEVLATSFVAIDAVHRAGARGARRDDAPPDRLADEGDDGAHRDRARQPRRARRRHACRDERRAVQRGSRRRARVHARDAPLVGAARLEQRLGHGARDRRGRRLARRVLRARERRGRRRSG